MKNLGLLIGSLVVMLVAVVGAAVVFSNKSAQEPSTVDQALVVGDARHTKGKADAKVTIVEFSDLQCPACRAAQPLVTEILQSASDSARLVYRHFPLRSIHPNAEAAAKASEAAANQGAFFAYHDLLFATQQDWEGEKDPTQKFLTLARQLNLDITKFTADMNSEEVKNRIAKDEQDGNQAGVSSTPTFYVNGKMTDSLHLKSEVEKALQTQ